MTAPVAPSNDSPGPPGRLASPVGHDFAAILQAERQRGRWGRWARRGFWIILLGALLVASWRQSRVDLWELLRRLPVLADWLALLWPPNLAELQSFLEALWETLAIAIVGTALALVAAIPLAIGVARTTAPVPWLAIPLRLLLNVLRAIDTLIFALFFVAVVGLGPFAGVLGIALHTTGSMGKLLAEVLETIPQETLDGVEATGAGRLRTFVFAVLPEALPGLAGVALYLWEFNVRSSVILGIVGAGGIGYELLVSIKMFDFPRLATLLLLVLVMVSAIDAASAWLRRRLR
jgi:phosphonate transport system permease protein